MQRNATLIQIAAEILSLFFSRILDVYLENSITGDKMD